MPNFSLRSLGNLVTCCSEIQDVLQEAIKHTDFTVLCGHRNEADQNKAFAEGNSKVKWPISKHNTKPSLAVDIAPYPIDWNDNERFVLLAGAILWIARSKGYRFRWGGDWDMDGQMTDEKFRDWGHFEYAGPFV